LLELLDPLPKALGLQDALRGRRREEGREGGREGVREGK